MLRCMPSCPQSIPIQRIRWNRTAARLVVHASKQQVNEQQFNEPGRRLARMQQTSSVVTPPPATSSSMHLMQLISACVEANDAVHRFEVAAGRSAMIGFAVSVFAELFLPKHGLFGSWSGDQLSTFSALALALVCCSALLAVYSKRRLGTQLKSRLKDRMLVAAVFTSLTALSRSKSSLSLLDVDSAVDAVFDTVFNTEIMSSFYGDDEWICPP